MKTKHLLAALVLPAVFSACSQDELVTNNAEKEVVGTPIGYLEFTASRGSDATTRLGDSGWEAEDKISMGWISAEGLEASANLYSNHPLRYKSDNSSFKSETMIYEGLYIASFPFQETQKVTALAFDLKNQQSEANFYSKRWYVSEKFFTLDEHNAGLGKATSIKLVPLTNLVKLNIKLNGAQLPEDFKVIGVKLTDGGNSYLMQDLVLQSSNPAAAADNLTLADAVWAKGEGTTNSGKILVQVGEEGVGTAIGTDGLDVYIQMGKFSSTDDTELTIETNYGEASITTGASSVSWSSTGLGQAQATEVESFAAAITAAATAAGSASKQYGQNVVVNVTLDAATIETNNVITSQADLEKYVDTLERLGKLGGDVTVSFGQSKLETTDGVESKGDVIITDISPLNKIEGQITFTNESSAPAHVYIAGELALQAEVAANAATFQVLEGSTLTVSKNLDLKGTLLTVNAGATLVNKAEIAANTGASYGVTTMVGKNASGVTPAVPAGLYISEAGASLNFTAGAVFTNNGAIEWKGGTLPAMSTNGGLTYAKVADIKAISKAASAFNVITDGSAVKEIIISDDLTAATQLTASTFEDITKMTINGNVTFNLEDYATPFTFSDLTVINVESGSFNLTGGNQGTGSTDFCAFAADASTGCTLTLAAGTKLNLAAGTKLDLGTNTGVVDYKGASVVNAGYIVASSSLGNGQSSWSGNSIKGNPKE